MRPGALPGSRRRPALWQAAPRGRRGGVVDHLVGDLLAIAFGGLAVLGIGYALAAALAVRRFARRRPEIAAPPRPVTVLKPLHGAEPGLADSLLTALRQDHPAPVQV